MAVNVVLALVFLGVGALCVALGVPLLRGRVPPNYLYGCRARATLSDEKLWYEVNRVGGRDMIRAGVLIAAMSLAVLAFRRSVNTAISALVLITVSLACVARLALHCLRGSRRA